MHTAGVGVYSVRVTPSRRLCRCMRRKAHWMAVCVLSSLYGEGAHMSVQLGVGLGKDLEATVFQFV